MASRRLFASLLRSAAAPRTPSTPGYLFNRAAAAAYSSSAPYNGQVLLFVCAMDNVYLEANDELMISPSALDVFTLVSSNSRDYFLSFSLSTIYFSNNKNG